MHNDFGSSPLVRLLADWMPVPAPIAGTAGMDFAERLSLSLTTFDAIGLQSALPAVQAIRAPSPARPGQPAPTAAALREDLQRTRSALAKAISQDPRELPDLPGDPANPYALFQQRHLALQRQMEQLVTPLRDHVRQSVARASAGMRQLAAMDAVLEQVLAAREQRLLPAVPALLARRFEQRRQQAAGDGADGAWLDAFAQDWRQALLAEVDLRLQPVAGLIDALGNARANAPAPGPGKEQENHA